MRRLNEGWLRRQSRCVCRLKHHQLRKSGLKTEHRWTGVEGCQARVLSTQSLSEGLTRFHLSDLGLLLYSGMYLSLSLGLCWWSLCSPNPRAIEGLFKLHPPQGLLIICIINTRGLEVYLSAQINPDILEYSSKESVVGEYLGRALTT